jgi:hypothetical protein
LLHDLLHRPEGDALAVGQTAASQHDSLVLDGRQELLDESRLPCAGRPQHGEQVAGPISNAPLEVVLQQRSLALPSNHGRIEMAREGRSSRFDLQQPESGNRLFLAFERE